MSNFIQQLAQKLIDSHSLKELKDVTVVIPSRRASIHLKKELAKISKKTIWSPKIRTLDQFLTDFYDKEIVEQTHAMVLLYRAYCSTNKEPEDFNHFLNWGEQILGDFNEIDRYLLNQKDVFKNLKDIKDIEAWSFNTQELSTMQKQFLTFWENLGTIYTSFHNELNQLGLSTKSKMYRDMAENYEQFFKQLNTPVYFAGFNALSTAEEIIFKQLSALGKATILWDVDPYYVNSKEQEAGYFFRKYDWDDSIHKTPSKILNHELNIKIYPANSKINQLKIAGNILAQNPNYFSTKTALILADETLLQPLLFTLPDSEKNVNITMGFPLRQTAAGDLVKILFSILQNSRKQHSKGVIYYKDFFSLIDNTLINVFIHRNEISKKLIQNQVHKNNLAYITNSFIQNQTKHLLPELSEFINFKDNTTTNILSVLQELLEKLRLFLVENELYKEESEAIYLIQKIIHQLQLQTEKYPELNDIDTFEKLFFRKLATEKLSFYGEPLQGLQIMGLLETRAIDFEDVILIAANEKFLPGNKHPNSIIPTDLRAYLGLPNKFEREAIFSYYVYRLLHQAKTIHFIYNNDFDDKLNSNEISRYLLQLENELPEKVEKIEVVFEHEEIQKVTEIQKEDTFPKIDSFFDSGLSPSALNTYINCSKDFYFKYLLRVKEDDTVEEAMESSTKGDIVHKVLQVLYEDAAKHQFPAFIKKEHIEQMLARYKTLTEELFYETFKNDTFKFGKNYLDYKMALKSIEKFLQNELSLIQEHGNIELLGVETEFKSTLNMKTEQGEKTILLKGKFDRVDKVNGQIRVIDYKTGKVEAKDVKLAEDITKESKALQLLFYKYLYFKETRINPSAGIISMINLKAGLIELNTDKVENELEAFEALIISVVEQLYNTEFVFQHPSTAKYCLLCEN